MFQGFFNYDNEIWRFVGRLADIMVLNFLWGITDALILLWVFVFLYVWPLLSRFENSWQKTIFHALLMSIRHLPYTLGILLMDFALVVGVYFLLRILPMFVPVFFILGFPLIAWANSAFFRRIFKQYERIRRK